MKRVTLLMAFFLALTLTAGAQTMIRFIDLPPAGTPQAVPENYANMHWSGIDYVSTMMWDYSNGNMEYGDGFMIGPEAMVAFVGGPMCYKKHGGTTIANVCQASISGGIGVGMSPVFAFRPDYMIASLGWNCDGQQSVVVEAYNNGILVGFAEIRPQGQCPEVQAGLPNRVGTDHPARNSSQPWRLIRSVRLATEVVASLVQLGSAKAKSVANDDT